MSIKEIVIFFLGEVLTTVKMFVNCNSRQCPGKMFTLTVLCEIK